MAEANRKSTQSSIHRLSLQEPQHRRLETKFDSTHLTDGRNENETLSNLEVKPTVDIDIDQEKGLPIVTQAAIVLPSATEVDFNWKGWMTVAGGFLMQFGTFGYTYTFGVFQDYYTRVFLTHNTASEIGWVGGANFMFACGFGLISGKIFDLGYFYAVIIAGAALYIFSLFMLSLAKQDQFYQIFLAQGGGMGLASGLTLVPTLGIMVHHFPHKNRALAVGVALSGGGFGGIAFPIMINNLLKTHSFGESVRASGYVVIGCMVGAVLLMRSSPLPKGSTGVPQPSALSFFKEVHYVMLIIGSFITLLGVYFPAFFMQLFAVQQGIDENFAFYSLAIINAGSVIGRIAGNYVSDIVGPFNTIMVVNIFAASIIWAMLGVKDKGSLVVVSGLYGIFSGAAFSLISAATVACASSPREIGLRNGIAFAIFGVALLFSGPIQGAAVGNDYTWIKAVAYAASVVYASVGILFIGRMSMSKARKLSRV